MRQIAVRPGSAGKKGMGTLLPGALDMGAEPEDLEGRVPLPPRGGTEPQLSVQPCQPGFPLLISGSVSLSLAWTGPPGWLQSRLTDIQGAQQPEVESVV